MWNAFLRWINQEKAAFCTGAAWLLLVGLRYQAAPSLDEWGPQRTDVPPPEEGYVSLAAPPPLAEFLAGDRGNPFSDVERRTAFQPKPLPRYKRPKPPAPRRPPRPAKIKPPPPPPAPKPPPKQEPPKPAEKPKPYDLPVRVVGRFEVSRLGAGSSGVRTVFAVKEDGRYIAVKEGDELPGLGVRVIRATKSVVIVENEKGQRFRLNDLLRSRASAEAGGGGEETTGP